MTETKKIFSAARRLPFIIAMKLRGKCDGWSLGKITPVEAQIQTKTSFVLSVKSLYCWSMAAKRKPLQGNPR
jgi:hypothetical protein